MLGCISPRFGSLARVPLAKLGWRYWHLVEMSSRLWVALLVLLLGDLRIAGADKSVQAEDATLPVWTIARPCCQCRPKSFSKAVNFKYEFSSRSIEAGGETAQDVAGPMQKG